MVWNFAGYDFLLESDEQAPPSVNASLWLQGKLTAIAGPFQVASSSSRTIHQSAAMTCPT
ncbi:hypothetical protein [Streptomyces syringium]|uniref:hypothetical protein n=1 Tax=Streptomyces syringium TaxID=76729 RepID=UPI00341A88CE